MQTLTFECDLDSTRNLVLNLPASVPLGHHRVAVVIDPPETETAGSITPGIVEEPARAELWKRLLTLREQSIADGMHMMNWDEINAEVRERRGGVSDE